MTEDFLIKCEGGPHEGTRVVPSTVMSWPLPDKLGGAPDAAEQGDYIKVSESKLPPIPSGSHVMRGALYRWEPST